MIGHYLSNNNERATVSKFKYFCELNRALEQAKHLDWSSRIKIMDRKELGASLEIRNTETELSGFEGWKQKGQFLIFEDRFQDLFTFKPKQKWKQLWEKSKNSK